MIELRVGNYSHKVNSFVFNGGEVQVKVERARQSYEDGSWNPYRIYITAHLRNSNDIMELFMVTDAARREFGNLPIELTMPYTPYARQDRVCAPGEALSLKVFANLINSQGYDLVKVWDAHSDVATALIDNCENVPQEVLLEGAPIDGCILVAPDAGALKKTTAVAKKFGLSMIRADKSRDPATGAITGTVVYSEPVGAKDFLIVDDICDGGRTFVELAKALRPLTKGKIFLYVTHGIFSAGFDILRQHIDHIYTANSFVDLKFNSQLVTQLEIKNA